MNRFERRKTRTHESILAAATALIGEKGLDRLSLEEVADKADVARATLYNHYADRGGLLREVLEPVFRSALDRVEGMLHDPATISLGTICTLCVELWERHGERFGLLEPSAVTEEIEALHGAFAARFVALFVPLAGRLRFRIPDARATGMLVYRCFVPILRSIEGARDRRALFEDMVAGLVIADRSRG